MIFYLMVFEFRRGVTPEADALNLSVACPHPALCAILASSRGGLKSEGQKYCPPLGEVAPKVTEEDEITGCKTFHPVPFQTRYRRD
jgi:hypothetical protein